MVTYVSVTASGPQSPSGLGSMRREPAEGALGDTSLPQGIESQLLEKKEVSTRLWGVEGMSNTHTCAGPNPTAVTADHSTRQLSHVSVTSAVGRTGAGI